MNFRIRYNREKIKELVSYLQKAYELGDIHIVKRVSAMLRIYEGQSISYISQTLGVSIQSVYNWLKAFLLLEYNSRITVHPLPSYSPDYNPIEYLWKKVKKGTTHNRYFPDFEMLVDTVERVLERLTQVPEEVLALRGEYRKSFDDLKFPVAA